MGDESAVEAKVHRVSAMGVEVAVEEETPMEVRRTAAVDLVLYNRSVWSVGIV